MNAKQTALRGTRRLASHGDEGLEQLLSARPALRLPLRCCTVAEASFLISIPAPKGLALLLPTTTTVLAIVATSDFVNSSISCL